ncbi:MAG: nucleotidyltransferase domain-containing protein [Lachnospiraceae bacterium]|nr:nucleotidyltransferase domain-containing protein [Lachnospiraceae bacterium]
MCTRNELNNILQEITETYKSVYAESLVRVILYGSYARGDYDNESDIDIAAIVQGSREILQKQLKQVWEVSSELELEYETIISPTVIPYEEFEKYREDLPYYRNIDEEGIEIGNK